MPDRVNHPPRRNRDAPRNQSSRGQEDHRRHSSQETIARNMARLLRNIPRNKEDAFPLILPDGSSIFLDQVIHRSTFNKLHRDRNELETILSIVTPGAK